MTKRMATSLLILAAISTGGHTFPHNGQENGRRLKQAGKAVYFITNEAANSIIALPIGSNGMLSNGKATETGGMGGNALDAATKQPAMSDVLFSQSALTIAGNVSNPSQLMFAPTWRNNKFLTLRSTSSQSTQDRIPYPCYPSHLPTLHV